MFVSLEGSVKFGISSLRSPQFAALSRLSAAAAVATSCCYSSRASLCVCNCNLQFASCSYVAAAALLTSVHKT